MDISKIAELGTAGGTLILAIATFASVRSANRAARVAETALLVGMRPVLVPSLPEDRIEQIGFAQGETLSVEGGSAAIEVHANGLLLGAALRNVGAGLAVIQGWWIGPSRSSTDADHQPLERFRRLTRDLYVPAGATGFWQGTIRDRGDPQFDQIRDALARGEPFTVELLYSDHVAWQQFVTRLVISRRTPGDWTTSAARHWNL
jgi:hypothetical protein